MMTEADVNVQRQILFYREHRKHVTAMKEYVAGTIPLCALNTFRSELICH